MSGLFEIFLSEVESQEKPQMERWLPLLAGEGKGEVNRSDTRNGTHNRQLLQTLDLRDPGLGIPNLSLYLFQRQFGVHQNSSPAMRKRIILAGDWSKTLSGSDNEILISTRFCRRNPGGMQESDSARSERGGRDQCRSSHTKRYCLPGTRILGHCLSSR